MNNNNTTIYNAHNDGRKIESLVFGKEQIRKAPQRMSWQYRRLVQS